MAQVEQVFIFLASPGDVPLERRYVSEVVDDLNHTIGLEKGLALQVISWEGDAYPGYGKDAQALINEQIAAMARYTLFVGIMWKRLGTPTPRAASGTVEEFERAAAAQAQDGQPAIWFYFRKPPARRASSTKKYSDDEFAQLQKVADFRKQVEAKGLPWSYSGPSDFRKKFSRQMILWTNSLPRRAIPATSVAEISQLPPQTYHHLIGRRDEMERIMAALLEAESKRGILIVGLGGIGKTSLAREAAEQCRSKKVFEQIIWASFKKELFVGERIAPVESSKYSFTELLNTVIRQCHSMIQMSAKAEQRNPAPAATNSEESGSMERLPLAEKRVVVGKLLNEKRLLIVLDNLETIPNGAELVASMFEILGQGKILITSRHQVIDDRIYNIQLAGFSEDEGVTFLTEEGKERGIQSVAGADRSTLVTIHRLTGGAPLAMKLVVGQLSRQPLEVVCETLKEASAHGQAYELYRFIYRYSWSMLDMKSRMALVDMSVFPPLVGGAAKDVKAISQVAAQDFWPAMDQLIRLSLVDRGGVAGAERFYLHTLTSNFVRSDITKEKEWSE